MCVRVLSFFLVDRASCINLVASSCIFHHVAMAAQHNRLDDRVRAFLEKRGYGAKQHVFAGMDFETFMKLPDNLLRHLGLSFVEDRGAVPKADRPFTKKNGRLECGSDDDSDQDEPHLRRAPHYVTEERVTSRTVPRLGDGCCGKRVHSIKACPESPDAYRTQLYFECYYD